VETCVPIEEPKLAARLRDDVHSVYRADNVQAWELRPDGTYARIEPGNQAPVKAQEILLERLSQPLGPPPPADGRLLRMPRGGGGKKKRPGAQGRKRAQ
jgi:hypothetical protein